MNNYEMSKYYSGQKKQISPEAIELRINTRLEEFEEKITKQYKQDMQDMLNDCKIARTSECIPYKIFSDEKFTNNFLETLQSMKEHITDYNKREQFKIKVNDKRYKFVLIVITIFGLPITINFIGNAIRFMNEFIKFIK